MIRIISLPDNVRFELGPGETLLEGALRAGIPLRHACAGRAKCSTCRIWVVEGLEHCAARSEPEGAMAEKLAFGEEVRLACQLRPTGALRIRRLVLDETDLAMSSQLERDIATRSGETRNVTIFFSDVVGFTAIAQTMSPYDVMYLLNRYFAEAGQIIEQNGGYVDKFIGDGMMAIFGLEDGPDAPVRAVNAALQTLALVDRLKPFFASLYGVAFGVRIGLHYGEAVTGSLGSLGHERLTAVGDVVNVASRVEAANKEAGTRLLVSDALYQQVETQVEVADFVRTRLRGTSERVTLHEIARLTPDTEAALNARESRETMRSAGRDWTRLAGQDELGDGHRRVFELDACDLVVVRQGETFFAFNNACPHLHLPFFEKRDADKAGALVPPGSGREVPRDSQLTDDRGLVCRWHDTRFDLQTGEVRDWCPRLQADGTSQGWEFLGDLSKNRAPMTPVPCLVKDGFLWVALD